jgi:hypothetical protein
LTVSSAPIDAIRSKLVERRGDGGEARPTRRPRARDGGVERDHRVGREPRREPPRAAAKVERAREAARGALPVLLSRPRRDLGRQPPRQRRDDRRARQPARAPQRHEAVVERAGRGHTRPDGRPMPARQAPAAR